MKNWRKLYSEGFVVNILHQDYSDGKITNDRGILRVWERGALHTEFWCVTRISVGKPRRRWEDNTKMNPQETRWSGVDWFDLALDRDKLWAL
jgi:hypothetical protein